MISQQSKGLIRLKGHSKSNSTDTLNSVRKKKFLSVVSATNSNQRPAHPTIKTVAQLKRQAMGHRTTRSNSQQISQTMNLLDQNRNYVLNVRMEEQKGNKIRIKPNLTQLTDWSQQLKTGLQTPIKKLLFQSTCKENFM